jgi:molybdenum cofactor cytidylyltransferase
MGKRDGKFTEGWIVQHLIASEKETDAIVVMVCDQPLLSSSHLITLSETYRNSSHKIVASRYGDSIGVPALFDSSLFSQLVKINDTQGAKAVIENNLHAVAIIDWADGSMDIDTPEDLIKLKSTE